MGAPLLQAVPPPGGQPPPDPEVELAFLEALKNRRGARKIKLSMEKERELVDRILSDVSDGVSTNGKFRSNRLEFLRVWRGLTEKKTFPFHGAANVQVPFLSTAKEQMGARLHKGLLGEPGTKATTLSSLSEAIDLISLEESETWFNWELEEVVCLRQKMREIVHHLLLDGFCVVIPYYDHVEREVRYERVFEFTDEQLDFQCRAALEQCFSESKEFEILEADDLGVYEVEHRTLDGEKREAHVAFSLDDQDLIATVTTTEVVFDGVKIDILDSDDIVVVNSGATIPDLPFFSSRGWLAKSDYMEGVEDGTYISYADPEDNRRVAATASTKTPALVPQLKTEALDQVEGGQSTDPSSGTGQDYRSWIEFYRWEGEVVLKKGDRPTGVVAWVVPSANKIIRIERLDELTRYGERTPIKFDFIVQPGRFYSIGLMEWGRHIQIELDAIHNQRLDSGLIAMVPFGFYTPMAGHAKTILSLEPGKMYPVKDPNGVIFPRMNWNPVWGFQEEGLVKKYGQELVGLSEPAIGSFTTKRMSASEYAGTSESLDLRTDLILEGLAEPFRKLLYRILELYQRHMPDGRVFQVANEKGEKLLKYMKRSRLSTRVMLHLTSNPQQIAVAFQRDASMNLLSMLLNPFLVEMGITRPDTVFEAVNKVIKTHGYRGVPIHKPDAPPLSDPPEVEHKRMSMGEHIEPSLIENHQEHLADHVKLRSDPNLPSLMAPEAIAILDEHIQWTTQMAQQVMMMRQQQAALAGEMQAGMAEQGVRPGKAGGQQAGQQANPGSKEEGVRSAPGENQS